MGDYAFSPTISDDGKKALIFNGVGIQVVDLETGTVTGIAGTQTAPHATFVPGGSSVYALGQDLSNPSDPVSYIVHITGNAANDAPEDITVDAVGDPDGDGVTTYQAGGNDPDGDEIITPQDAFGGRVDITATTLRLHPRRQYTDGSFTVYANDGHGGITAYSVSYVAPEPPEQPEHVGRRGHHSVRTLSPDKTRAYQYSYNASSNRRI